MGKKTKEEYVDIESDEESSEDDTLEEEDILDDESMAEAEELASLLDSEKAVSPVDASDRDTPKRKIDIEKISVSLDPSKLIESLKSIAPCKETALKLVSSSKKAFVVGTRDAKDVLMVSSITIDEPPSKSSVLPFTSKEEQFSDILSLHGQNALMTIDFDTMTMTMKSEGVESFFTPSLSEDTQDRLASAVSLPDRFRVKEDGTAVFTLSNGTSMTYKQKVVFKTSVVDNKLKSIAKLKNEFNTVTLPAGESKVSVRSIKSLKDTSTKKKGVSVDIETLESTTKSESSITLDKSLFIAFSNVLTEKCTMWVYDTHYPVFVSDENGDSFTMIVPYTPRDKK